MSVREFSSAWWAEVRHRVLGGAVFLSAAAAESLHWQGGGEAGGELGALLDAGAAALYTLSPFEFARKNQRKGVFISECTSTQLDTIRVIIQHSDFTHCILIATVGLDVIYAELNEERDITELVTSGKVHAEATKHLEKMLLGWIDKKQSAVEVIHIPLFAISLTNQIFVTPPYSSLYPTHQGNLLPDTNSIDLYSLSGEERAAVRRLASNLSSMLDSMNLKEDIFYMGTFSSILSGVLEYSPVCSARRKNCSNPASVILVDRTLDLCGVTSHSSESMLDKIMTILPRFPGHSTEVAVDMSAVCEANVISVTEDVQLAAGCLYHAAEDSCVQTFDHMVNKTQKEVMFDLYNKLSALDVQKSPGPRKLLRVTPQSVEKIVVAAKGNYDVIGNHLGLLQQSLAVVQTLKSPQYAQLELIVSLEKQVLQNIATSRDSTSVLNQISHLIKTRKERNLSLERLLALTVHVYSLAGCEVTFTRSHEGALTETLSVAIFEEHRSLLGAETGDIATPEMCDAIAVKFIKRLANVGQMRKILTRYNSVLKPTESGTSYEYRGLLQQLVEDLVDSDRPELVDLKHRNEGIKDLFRSGLNILTSKKPRSKHPLDNPTVIIFVVGGVTAEECRNIHRAVITSGTDARLTIGSTKLVQPVEAMRDALGLSNINM